MIFLGYSGSGKTTALTGVARELTRRRAGSVGTLKHIHDPDFTIDTKGKDTWLHSTSGATLVVALAEKEMSVIKRGAGMGKITIDKILEIYRREKIDYVLIEGLYRRFSASGRKKGVVAVLCASTTQEVDELLARHRGLRILCITGPVADAKALGKGGYRGIPVLALPRGTKKIVDLITIRPRLAKQKTNIGVRT